MTLPHAFKRIELHLARSKEFPAGSPHHGYQFLAPLDDKGHIDADLWKTHREQCRVRRFWQGQDDQIGQLVHKPGGNEHARWVFDYDVNRVDDDEIRLSLRHPHIRSRRICDHSRHGFCPYVQGRLGRGGPLAAMRPDTAARNARSVPLNAT